MSENNKNITLQSNPYLIAGTILMGYQKYEEAVKYLENGLKLEPENFAIASNIGECYKKMAFFEKAIEYYNIAIEIDASHITAYQGRGVCNIRLGYYSKAIKDLTICINSGFFIFSFFYRGYAYFCLEAFEIAIIDLNHAISFNEKHADPYFYRGLIFFYRKEYNLYELDFFKHLYLSFQQKSINYRDLLFEFWSTRPYNLVWLSQNEMLTEISILDPAEQAFSKLKYFLFWFDFQKELNLFQDKIAEESERALLAFYGGCPVLTYIIYDEILEMMEQPEGSNNYYALSLQQQYYFARSAMAIQTEAEAVLEAAVDEARDNSLTDPRDAYYAGRIHLLAGNNDEAILCFKKAGSFVPAQIMLISLQENKELQTNLWQQLLNKAPEGLSYFMDAYSKEAFDFQFNKEGVAGY
jgi:tetratricopeptide (TPR) repeat protein